MAELIMTEEGSTPATPSTNKWKVYFKSTGLYIIDDVGTEIGPILGTSQLGAGVASFLATPSSANLATALTDENGSGGGFVRATSPTLTTPALGTPSALVLTNATGIPSDASSNPGTTSKVLKTDASGVLTTQKYVAIDATDSTSTTTGSLQTAGGLGVAKNIVTGGFVGIGANPAYSVDAQVAGGANRNLLRLAVTAVSNGLAVTYLHTGTIVNVDLQGQMVIGSPTGGAKGAGTLNAQAVYDDNVLLTDFVFEEGYNYLSIFEMKRFYEEHLHLPTIMGRDEWEKDGKPSLGKLVNQLWETIEVQARYIAELDERLKKINA